MIIPRKVSSDCSRHKAAPSMIRRSSSDSQKPSTPKRRKTLLVGAWIVLAIACGDAVADTPMVTRFTYDAGGNVTSVTDPRGLVTNYSYDGLGQLWQQVSPDTGTTSYSYDAYGRQGSMTRADGSTTTFNYDGLNRTVSRNAGGQSQALTYDTCTNGIGRLCTLSDSTGSVSYTYTPEGWVTGRGFSIAGTMYALGYDYDSMGHVTTVNYPDGNQAVYSYADGVVSGVQLNVGGNVSNGATNVTYQPGDTGMTQWTSSNGIANTLSYDSDGRLTGISAASIQSLALSYDLANRISGITNGVDNTMTQDFTYDEMSRLTSVSSGADNEAFTYDANGNRLSQVLNSAAVTVSPNTNNNQIMGLSGSSNVTYGYDAKGNLTTVSGTPTFSYDAFNRMDNAGPAAYYVGPEGQRLSKTVSSVSTYFAPDAKGPLMAESQGGGWSDYIWLNGRLIGRINGDQILAIHDDQVGRPEVMTDPSQAIAWRAKNFAFDRQVTVANAVPLNLGFPGQYYDSESGLWNNGYRDYCPSCGRYVESDPLGLAGGINTYAYAGSNPLSNVDPMGLDFFGKCLAQKYLQEYGANAWSQARQDRNTQTLPATPGSPMEALRNAENYLYSYQELPTTIAGSKTLALANTFILSVGYGDAKFYGGQSGLVPGWANDPPDLDQLEAGMEGTQDAQNGSAAASGCGCN